MVHTFCDTSSAGPARAPHPALGPVPGSDRSRLPGTLAAESRAYFRCEPLAATISVQQCRANRARLSPHEALALPFDLPSWWVQPLPCWSCSLAPRVEAGRVPFFSAEEVLAGRARGGAQDGAQALDGGPANGPAWPGSGPPAPTA
jgi:hypothetical protein